MNGWFWTIFAGMWVFFVIILICPEITGGK